MKYFKNKFNNANIVFFYVLFFLIFIFLVSLIVYKDDKDEEYVQTDLFEEIDLIESAEAEEVEMEFLLESNEQVEKDDDLLKESDFPKESEEVQEVVKEVAPIKKPVPQKKTPSSMTKYGIVFYPPNQYKRDNLGRMICKSDKDEPGVSKQDKPVHIDMQCCLDPDEIPNPFCYYPSGKYGKLLADFERKKEKMLRRYHAGKGL